MFDKTALHIAVEKGSIEIIQLLLSQSGIVIDAKDNIYLYVFTTFIQISLWFIFELMKNTY